MSTPLTHEVLQQAAAWYSQLNAGQVGEQDLSRWCRWLEQRSEHRQAWTMVENVAGRFGRFHDDIEKQAAFKALQVDGPPRMGRRRALLSLGGLSIMAWGGWHTLGDVSSSTYIGGHWADYSTSIGERRQWPLANGSSMWLNTGSVVNQRRGSPSRIELIAGELQVDERQSSGGGLVVMVGQDEIVSRDALFNVRLQPGGFCVDVFAGTVEVMCQGQRRRLGPDQQLRYGEQGITAVAPANLSHRAWVQGVMVAEGLALAQVIAELGRYRHGHLGCNPKVAALSVVGTFSVRNTDRALASLQQALPISVSALFPWWVTVEPRV